MEGCDCPYPVTCLCAKSGASARPAPNLSEEGKKGAEQAEMDCEGEAVTTVRKGMERVSLERTLFSQEESDALERAAEEVDLAQKRGAFYAGIPGSTAIILTIRPCAAREMPRGYFGKVPPDQPFDRNRSREEHSKTEGVRREASRIIHEKMAAFDENRPVLHTAAFAVAVPWGLYVPHPYFLNGHFIVDGPHSQDVWTMKIDPDQPGRTTSLFEAPYLQDHTMLTLYTAFMQQGFRSTQKYHLLLVNEQAAGEKQRR